MSGQPGGRRGPNAPASLWRQGATRIGIPYDEYRARVLTGEKWCSRCKCWQPRSEFGPHKRYGLDSCCRESSRAAARAWQRAHREGTS